MSNTAEDLKYKTKNILLEHPADWYINKDTFDAVSQSIEPIMEFYKQKGDTERKNTQLDQIIQEPCLLYTSPSPRDKRQSRMPSSA